MNTKEKTESVVFLMEYVIRIKKVCQRVGHKPLAALITISMILIAGCGKYANPEPPERLSPAAIELREVQVSSSAVNLNWLAPKVDRRGKKLRELIGYRIYRKELTKAADAIDLSIPFEVVATVDDVSIKKLQKKREEAVVSGSPARRVDLKEDERRISFSDTTVIQGHTYLYKIAPFSAESFDGAFDNLIKVIFTGTGSIVTIVPLELDNLDIVGSSVNSIEGDLDDFSGSDFMNSSGAAGELNM